MQIDLQRRLGAQEWDMCRVESAQEAAATLTSIPLSSGRDVGISFLPSSLLTMRVADVDRNDVGHARYQARKALKNLNRQHIRFQSYCLQKEDMNAWIRRVIWSRVVDVQRLVRGRIVRRSRMQRA